MESKELLGVEILVENDNYDLQAETVRKMSSSLGFLLKPFGSRLTRQSEGHSSVVLTCVEQNFLKGCKFCFRSDVGGGMWKLHTGFRDSDHNSREQ